MNLKQIYGQTEISGISCIHRADNVDFTSVGQPIPETEVQIDQPDSEGVGEIISRSPALFLGYLKNEEATKETIVDGWLCGARFSPMFIENKLKFCPYIVECIVLGHERDYVTA